MSDDLCIGITFAIFELSGNMPVLRDNFITWVNPCIQYHSNVYLSRDQLHNIYCRDAVINLRGYKYLEMLQFSSHGWVKPHKYWMVLIIQVRDVIILYMIRDINKNTKALRSWYNCQANSVPLYSRLINCDRIYMYTMSACIVVASL